MLNEQSEQLQAEPPQSVQQPKVLMKIGGILTAIALATTALTTIVTNGHTILEKLSLVKAAETPGAVSSPNSQVNSSQNQPNASTHSFSPEKYEYKEDGKLRAFVHVSDQIWKEKDEFDQEFNTFKEIERDSDFITIYDRSREMTIKIPIAGGQILITWKQENWVDLPYRYVTKVSDSN